jgi:hypothetical protein
MIILRGIACHPPSRAAAHSGGSACGYLAVGGPLSSPGMAYWMVACSVYSCIAILWGECPHLPRIGQSVEEFPEGTGVLNGWAELWGTFTPGDRRGSTLAE